MLTPSHMTFNIGDVAPDFNLVDYHLNITEQKKVSVATHKGDIATVIMFICNHCPYVIHIKKRLITVANQYMTKGVSFLAINSNDINSYPQDAPKLMCRENYPFPYLFDDTQQVAMNYKAACTPDFYVFDSTLKCYYRGRFDASSPGNDITVNGEDLVLAIESCISKKTVYPKKQLPSLGCNIKYR